MRQRRYASTSAFGWLTGLAFSWCVAALGSAATATPSEVTSSPSIAQTAPVQRLIDVGGRRVAFHFIAGRSPAVVFVAGGGMDSSAWDPVLSAIQRQTGAQLITYDRAGFGASDEDPRAPTLQQEVADLEAGLSALGADRKIVLVAHSYGGEVATAFVAANPGRVVRAVLIDANIPSFFTDAETARMAATFPKEMDTSDKQGRAMAAMFKAYPTMQHGFHAMQWPDNIPTAVIVSEHPPLATPAENAAWTQEHIRFAHEAANRTVSIAKNSGHLVMTDRPDLVTDAVVTAVAEVRQADQR